MTEDRGLLLRHGWPALEVVRGSLEILDEHIGEVPAEPLADHDAQHRNILGIRRHGVGRNLPAALALSFDQELGKDGLIGFFRFGIGDQDVTPTKTFVSGGLALDGPFGRARHGGDRCLVV